MLNVGLILISITCIIIIIIYFYQLFKSQYKFKQLAQKEKSFIQQQELNQLDIEIQNKKKQLSSLLKSIENREADLLYYEETLQKKIENLEKIDATYKSRVEACRREEEMNKKQDFYKLHLNEKEASDIQLLEKIKNQLFNPRILSMLIWSTYFQKQMTTLCNNVLGTKTISGIYKITNINCGKCYIGQSTDIATRFKTHAKCGLGIDTPANNKLYKAMEEEGLQNFTWELLEECPKDQLNEKEKYYISAYQANDYGYNSSKGISK